MEKQLTKYVVSLAINGRYYAHVEAADPAEAIKKANAACTEADFGDLETIDWSTVHVEDPSGNFLDPTEIANGRT